MRRHVVRRAAVVVTAGAVIGLAACGGDDQPTERTLRFTDREGTMRTSVDAPPRTLAREEITPGGPNRNDQATPRQLGSTSGHGPRGLHDHGRAERGRDAGMPGRDRTRRRQAVLQQDRQAVSPHAASPAGHRRHRGIRGSDRGHHERWWREHQGSAAHALTRSAAACRPPAGATPAPATAPGTAPVNVPARRDHRWTCDHRYR
jgi:hypothetical protein